MTYPRVVPVPGGDLGTRLLTLDQSKRHGAIAPGYSLLNLLADVATGNRTLWGAIEAPGHCRGVFFSELREEGGEKVLWADTLGPPFNLPEWAELFDEQLVKQAERLGATKIKFAGQPRATSVYRMVGVMKGQAVFQRAVA